MEGKSSAITEACDAIGLSVAAVHAHPLQQRRGGGASLKSRLTQGSWLSLKVNGSRGSIWGSMRLPRHRHRYAVSACMSNAHALRPGFACEPSLLSTCPATQGSHRHVSLARKAFTWGANLWPTPHHRSSAIRSTQRCCGKGGPNMEVEIHGPIEQVRAIGNSIVT